MTAPGWRPLEKPARRNPLAIEATPFTRFARVHTVSSLGDGLITITAAYTPSTHTHEPDSTYSRFYIVPSNEVAKYTQSTHRKWLGTPGKKGQAHSASAIRQFADPSDTYLERWDILGL